MMEEWKIETREGWKGGRMEDREEGWKNGMMEDSEAGRSNLL